MAANNNIPREIQDSIRDVLDRRIKISYKRMVKQEVRPDKVENRVLVFTPCRLFVLAGKVPTKVEHSFHFLDIQALESKKPNQLVITVDGKVYIFVTLEADTDEVNHMITHIGISLKLIFPAFPLERLIVKVDVIPPERLRTMNDMIKSMEVREVGPCGGFTTMYVCMCDYHNLPYREEVAWDVDTIYLSQDSRELCLQDFDHLNPKDLVPIISSLEHNTWFTAFNASNVRLTVEMANEIIKVMRRNAVIEILNLANTGIKVDFVQKLSTALLSNSGTQLSSLDLSGNLIEDRGVTHLFGTLKALARGLSQLDLSRTGITTRCMSKLAETLATSQTLLGSLQTLKLVDNGQKGEDMSGIYNFLAQPNVLTVLDLSGTDIAMDALCGPLLLGCPHIIDISLARTVFTHKRTKEVAIPVSWKQYFANTCSLHRLDLSSSHLPAEVLKELLLGIASNRHIKDLDLDISNNEFGMIGAQHISSCIANITCLGRLDISNNNFDSDLKLILPELAKNKHLKHLAIGRNFTAIKPRLLWGVLESIVELIQEEESVLESLSLADSKLKNDSAYIINALGSNTSLIEIDLSGNQIGDYGARMLGKALQINTHLRTVVWDKNGVTAQGFEDIANALEKNFTLRKMPFPVNDAAVAMRTQSERTEAALQKVECYLQRNHGPRKFASDQQYRLQQGFLISSTQQMVDRLCVQVQDSVNALRTGNTEAFDDELQHASKVVNDADNSKQLLLRLQEIAIHTQDAGNPVETTLQTMANNLKAVMEQSLQKTMGEMLTCTATHCTGVLSDEEFKKELESGCKSKSTLPRDFAKLVLEGIATDVFNKLSEMNLAVAAYISDSIVEEVISKLTESHKGLTNHLNLSKTGYYRGSMVAADQPEKIDKEKEKADDEESEKDSDCVVERLSVMGTKGSPKLSNKRKSIFTRKLRPQSVIDQEYNAGKLRSSEIEGESEESVCQNRLTMHEEEPDELDDKQKATPSKLEKVPEVRRKEPPSKGTGEEVEKLPDLQVQKLEHLNKDRPKRTKTRAPTRPVAPGIGVSDEIADDGINAFYTSPKTLETEAEKSVDAGSLKSDNDESGSKKGKLSKQNVSKPEKERKESGKGLATGISNFFKRHKSKDEGSKEKEKKQESSRKDKTDESPLPTKTDTSKVYTRPDSSRISKPDMNLHLSKVAVTPPLVEPTSEDSSIFQTPQNSNESFVDEMLDSKQTPSKDTLVEKEKKDDSNKVETSLEINEIDLQGSSADVESEGKKVNGTSPKLMQGTAKGGTGANVLADLKSKQERHSNNSLSSSLDGKKDTKEEKAKDQRKMSENNETNNNIISRTEKPALKEEPNTNVSENMLKPSVAPALSSKPSSEDTSVSPRPGPRTALMPPKRLVNNDTAAESTRTPSTVSTSSEVKSSTEDLLVSPKPAPRALMPPKKPVNNGSAAELGILPLAASFGGKPRPQPPAKPKPPTTAPKPRTSINRESGGDDHSGEAASPGVKRAEGEIVYDSNTLRLSVKDKIKRLSQVKLESPPSTSLVHTKTSSLPKDAKLPDVISEHEEGPEEDDITTDSMIMESKLEAQSSDVTNESTADKQQDDGKRTSAGNDEIMV